MSEFALSTLYPPLVGGFGFSQPIVTDEVAKADAKPVKPAEATRRSAMGSILGGGFFGGFGLLEVPIVSLALLQRMRQYPMVNKVLSRIAQPAIDAERQVEVIDRGAGKASAERIKGLAEDDLLPAIARAMPGAMEAPAFGNWLQEIIWDRKDGRTVPVDVNVIHHREGIIHVDQFRKFTGVEIAGQWIDKQYCFNSVHNSHFDRVLGLSCNTFAATAYLRSLKSTENADAIERKNSGVQFLFHVMQGVEVADATGAVIDGVKLVTDYMNAAVTGKSGLVPDMWFSKESIEKNPELAKIPYFRAEKFDWGDNGPALMAHLARLTRLDTEIFAAWGVPERALAEAVHGSRADAESHGDVVTAISGNWHMRACTQWDEQVTTPWLIANFPDPRVLVRIRPVKEDPQQEFRQDFVKTRMQATSADPNIDSIVDWRAELGKLGLTLRSEEDAAKVLAQIQAQKAKDAANKAGQSQEPNGDAPGGRFAEQGNGNGKAAAN